jgi:hypothetical protein
MSSRKIDFPLGTDVATVQIRAASLTLPATGVRVSKNGIEFRINAPIPIWTEMAVDLELGREARTMHCRGVVVACAGNRHAGYVVTMVLTDLSRQSEAQLRQFATPNLSS